MSELLEGSQAVAKVVSRCRPQVVCAYPISPQTHIVEALAGAVRTGELRNCEYINVESEFAAMSVAIGACATGARVYTATASQGLLYMVEAIYNASGMKLPVVMTVANRAIGAPINIWNDQSDSLSQRDSGWLQLFAADNQEAADLHIQAYRIAEELSIPVMVCMDGFVLTHATDVVEIATQEQIDAFLPPYDPPDALNIDEPTTIGMMSGPDSFTEVRYLQFQGMRDALDVVAKVGAEFSETFGRDVGGLVRTYTGNPGPAKSDEIVVVAMGSVVGTIQVVAEQLAQEGTPVKVIGVNSYRPFPDEALREQVGDAAQVVVVDRAVEPGIGGVLSGDVRRSLDGAGKQLRSIVAGLGGRPITERSLYEVFSRAAGIAGDPLEPLTFLDLNTAVLAEVK